MGGNKAKVSKDKAKGIGSNDNAIDGAGGEAEQSSPERLLKDVFVDPKKKSNINTAINKFNRRVATIGGTTLRATGLVDDAQSETGSLKEYDAFSHYDSDGDGDPTDSRFRIMHDTLFVEDSDDEDDKNKSSGGTSDTAANLSGNSQRGDNTHVHWGPVMRGTDAPQNPNHRYSYPSNVYQDGHSGYDKRHWAQEQGALYPPLRTSGATTATKYPQLYHDRTSVDYGYGDLDRKQPKWMYHGRSSAPQPPRHRNPKGYSWSGYANTGTGTRHHQSRTRGGGGGGGYGDYEYRDVKPRRLPRRSATTAGTENDPVYDSTDRKRDYYSYFDDMQKVLQAKREREENDARKTKFWQDYIDPEGDQDEDYVPPRPPTADSMVEAGEISSGTATIPLQPQQQTTATARKVGGIFASNPEPSKFSAKALYGRIRNKGKQSPPVTDPSTPILLNSSSNDHSEVLSVQSSRSPGRTTSLEPERPPSTVRIFRAMFSTGVILLYTQTW
jgi:hypothetical protein